MNEDQLRTRLPAVADPTDDSDWLDVRARAHAHNVAARPGRPAGRRALRRARPARLLAACVAVIAAVTALVELVPRGDDSRRVPGLDAIAAIAAAAPSTIPAAGEYAYSTRRFGMEGRSEDCTQEWWIAPDGSGRVRQHGELCTPLARDGRFGPGEATRMYVELFAPGLTASPEDLPTDPDRLESALYRALRGLADVTPAELDDPLARSDGMLDMIDQVLANPLASPALRSSLYRVAARLDGVKVRPEVIDPAGRAGSAITLERSIANGIREKRELIFDPATSRSLASRETATGTGYRSDGYHVYLEQATVDSLGARPR